MKKKLLLFAVSMLLVLVCQALAGIPEPTGINPATGAPWAIGDTYRLVFITAANPGSPVGWTIEDFNALIQSYADAAGMNEASWYVIGSSVDVDARDNTSTNPEDPNDPDCPILLIDGSTVVASGNADLWDGEVQNTISMDEYGNPKDHWPFTGTQRNGTKSHQFGALGQDAGNIGQGQSSEASNWIFRAWTGDPPATELPLYGMSEVLTFGSLPAYIYPTYGASLWAGDVTFLWENIEPDPGDANDVYVEVLFGTDPCTLQPLTLDPVSGQEVTTVTKTGLTDGIYYWQVNSDIGEPNMIEGPLYWFEIRSDYPPESVDIGPDMITWTGKGVDLTAIVSGDDSVSPLEYTWTYDAPEGVAVDIDTTAGEDIPTVTVTKVPELEPYAVNGSFEEPVLADGVEAFCAHNSTAVPCWIQTWYSSSEGIWKRGGYKAGAINPTVYTDIPEGENVGFVRSDTADNALQQDTSLIIQPNTTYTLKAKAGNSSATVTTTCRIEIGGATLAAASPSAASPDPCEWTSLTCTYISGADSNADSNIGQPLSIRLVAEAHAFGDLKQVDYDDVVLTIDGQPGGEVYNPEMSQVTINVAVNDGGEAAAVTDSMTIDVYETACQASEAFSPELFDPGDINKDCITDIKDLAEMAKTWLKDYRLPEPVEKP